jgi:hypothetical protein
MIVLRPVECQRVAIVSLLACFLGKPNIAEFLGRKIFSDLSKNLSEEVERDRLVWFELQNVDRSKWISHSPITVESHQLRT